MKCGEDMGRCERCGSGPLGNCGYYGAEVSRDLCPTPTPPSLSPGVGCELPIVAKLTFIDDAGEYEGTLVNPDGPEGAKLIEELVETLDGFVEARDRYLESDCDSHAEHMAANRLDEAHEAARAALARAKGDRA